MLKTVELSIPTHEHIWDWEWSGGWESEILGVECTFTYEIPPGPKGTKPRKRQCSAKADMDDVLNVFQEWWKI